MTFINGNEHELLSIKQDGFSLVFHKFWLHLQCFRNNPWPTHWMVQNIVHTGLGQLPPSHDMQLLVQLFSGHRLPSDIYIYICIYMYIFVVLQFEVTRMWWAYDMVFMSVCWGWYMDSGKTWSNVFVGIKSEDLDLDFHAVFHPTEWMHLLQNEQTTPQEESI